MPFAPPIVSVLKKTGFLVVLDGITAYMRFRRALDRGNVTAALLAASELQFVPLAEALELTLLLADKEPEKYERAAARWHMRFVQEVPNVDLRESQAVLALLATVPSSSGLPRRSQTFSAGDDPASESPRLLSVGRGLPKNGRR